MSGNCFTTLTFEVDPSDNVSIVRCHGKLVAGVSEMFYDKVHQLIPGTKRIVLDLSDLTRMDSMGLGALVRLYVSAKSAGCRLELLNLGKQIRELLGITHLWSVFAYVGECGTKMVYQRADTTLLLCEGSRRFYPARDKEMTASEPANSLR